MLMYVQLKKLRVRYIQEKEALLGPGTNVSKWRFFSKLDRFGDKIPKNMVVSLFYFSKFSYSLHKPEM